MHAIGDGANKVELDIFQKLGRGGRIEHAQLLHDSDLARFAALGVTASVQPEHAMDDRDVAERYWPGRTRRAFALRSLLDAASSGALTYGVVVEPDSSCWVAARLREDGTLARQRTTGCVHLWQWSLLEGA